MDHYSRVTEAVNDLFGLDENDSLYQNGEQHISQQVSDSEMVEWGGNQTETEDEGEGETEVSHPSENTVDESELPNNFNAEIGMETGMVFPSIELLYRCYKEHSKLKGFCIAKRVGRRCNSGNLKYVQICCDKGGKVVHQKKSKKVNCPARINCILRDDGLWHVSKVITDHNHELLPDMSVLMAGHRTMSTNIKRQLEAYDIAGVKMSKSVRVIEVQSGGPSSVSCTTKDMRNYVYKRRSHRLGTGDAEAVRTMFAVMKQKDRNFISYMESDSNGILTNLLWIHPRYRAAYEEFHDVISFDTTYLVNRYEMPFATIVGVNHHGNSILLGCALISHEDATSFKWLFSRWLEAMGNVHPTAILTDQCESIKIAVRDVMPNTIHRLCLWHILSKMPKKFKGVEDYNKCIQDFKALVYDSLTIDMFESSWQDFVVSHKLENNQWLKDLYRVRENWVPVYLKHFFWAGMVSTQRSEGMHAFFDGYITRRSTLKQFVEQYEIAICEKIDKEFMADFDSKSKVVMSISDFDFEIQFQNTYTNSIFKLVQKEIRRTWHCHPVPATDAEARAAEDNPEIKKLKIMERSILNDWYVKEFIHTVEYRQTGGYFDCSCKLMQCKGIPCCHIFKTMSILDVRRINDRYILRRWRKDVYRRYSKIFFPGAYPHMTDEYKKYQEVEAIFQLCTDSAMDDKDKLEFLKWKLTQVKRDIDNWDNMAVGERVTETNLQTTPSTDFVPTGTPLRDPTLVRRRGRPRLRVIPTRNSNSARNVIATSRNSVMRSISNIDGEAIFGTQASRVE